MKDYIVLVESMVGSFPVIRAVTFLLFPDVGFLQQFHDLGQLAGFGSNGDNVHALERVPVGVAGGVFQ